MKTFLTTHLMLSLHLTIIALVVSCGAWVVHQDKSEAVQAVTRAIERQYSLMYSLAETTDGNGADTVTSSIISDCPRREEFELLLVRLGTLKNKDLLNVQQLFESCGNFYAERKSLMVSRLEREFQILKDDTELLTALRDSPEETTRLNRWEELISLEKTRSAYLNEQTDIQGKIIAALIAGQNPNSKSVVDFVARAQELSESLSVLDKQIDTIRADLKV